MAYTSLADVKQYLAISSDSDDAVIQLLIASAQGMIDRQVGFSFEVTQHTDRSFYASSWGGSYGILWFDQWLIEATSVVNGDGTVVPTENYVLLEPNADRYYALTPTGPDSVAWNSGDSGYSPVVVTGRWGWSTEAPADISHATVRLTAWLYRQRENRGGDDDRAVIAGNSTLLPTTIPSDIKEMLAVYKGLTR